MESVGSDSAEDVSEREILPERVVDRLDMRCLTSFNELVRATVYCAECRKDVLEVALGERPVLATSILGYKAFWAQPVLAAGDQALLRVVTDECCKQRVAATSETIATSHHAALDTTALNGFEYTSHAGVKKIRHSSATCGLVLDMRQFGCGKIPEEDLGMTRRLFSNLLGDIADRQIDGICGFVSEEGNLCFVCRDDNWDNCRPRAHLLQGILKGHS